jgi:hypothetical protein
LDTLTRTKAEMVNGPENPIFVLGFYHSHALIVSCA